MSLIYAEEKWHIYRICSMVKIIVFNSYFNYIWLGNRWKFSDVILGLSFLTFSNVAFYARHGLFTGWWWRNFFTRLGSATFESTSEAFLVRPIVDITYILWTGFALIFFYQKLQSQAVIREKLLSTLWNREFHSLEQAKFAHGGSILGSSQFKLLPQLPLKMTLNFKIVKID